MKVDNELATKINKVHGKEGKILDVVSTVVLGIAAFGAGMVTQHVVHGKLWNKATDGAEVITEQPEETKEAETPASEE